MALLREPGLPALIGAAALIQGSHAAYYTFPPSPGRVTASAGWRSPVMGVGVLAESQCSRCRGDLRCPGSNGGDRRTQRGCALAITAQEPSVAVLAWSTGGPGLTWAEPRSAPYMLARMCQAI